MSNVLETWIPREDGTRQLCTIDLNTIWRETFSRWERLVESHVAERIATVTENILRMEAGEEVGPYRIGQIGPRWFVWDTAAPVGSGPVYDSLIRDDVMQWAEDRY